MLRFTNGERNERLIRGGEPFKELPQLFKGVGVQRIETGIQILSSDTPLSSCWPTPKASIRSLSREASSASSCN